MNVLCPRTVGLYRVSVCPWPILSPRRGRKYWTKQWPLSPIAVKLTLCCVREGNGSIIGRSDDGAESEKCVEVILLGSRRDSLMDFCSRSPLLSPILRFWTILRDDSGQIQLQERILNQGISPRMMENIVWQTSCKAVILVGSAAYGSDHAPALELLSNVKSRDGLVVGIILKPFRFEGKRRQEEVNDLLFKLQKLANFCIVLDADSLLENDLVTLDEAWKASNNSALMVMNAISILSSDKHKKVLNTKDNRSSNLLLPELMKILKSYSEARIAFGAACSIKTSIFQAVNGCAVDIKDPDGLIFCAVATSASIDSINVNDVFQTIRMIDYKGEIIASVVSEPTLEPGTVHAIVISFGYNNKDLAPQNGILLTLERHFPFIFNIFKNQHQQNPDFEETSLGTSLFSSVLNLPDVHYMRNENSSAAAMEDINEEDCSRNEVNFEENERELRKIYSKYSTFELKSEGHPILKGEPLARETLESESYGSRFSEVNALNGSVKIFKQPVGVKISKNLSESRIMKNEKMHGTGHKEKRQPAPNALPESTDYKQNLAASIDRDIQISNFKKQGDLSLRASSMLESERDTFKKWSRVVEMKYRGGRYKGRIEGGLPEGKGCLYLEDGSVYDGMWRNGKRSGSGTFYFSNGDFFQGSWRDDVMHGKGWMYFSSGDRWFANFWKGKANGEGRLYSKVGDVSFGKFKEGWRHGYFLHISSVDGTRCEELWDEGILVGQKQLGDDSD